MLRQAKESFGKPGYILGRQGMLIQARECSGKPGNTLGCQYIFWEARKGFRKSGSQGMPRQAREYSVMPVNILGTQGILWEARIYFGKIGNTLDSQDILRGAREISVRDPPIRSNNDHKSYNPSKDPYPSEQTRAYDEMCATAAATFGDAFPGGGGDAFRKGGVGGVGGGAGGVGGGGGGPPAPGVIQSPPADQRGVQFAQPGAVLMVYGLDALRTNADKLFNLMCLYGNVARIKFLKSKEGTAMVQMGDSVAVERCVQNLNNVAIGVTGAIPLTHRSNNMASDQHQDDTAKEHKLQLAFSKQPYLSEVTNPYPLPDKSPSYKLYVNNKNNRFMNPAMASKNRIQPPSKILHFFNTPPQVTEEELIQVFKDYDVVPPKAVKLFPMKSERSSSGLLEFENTTEAVAAVMACNHAAIESPGMKFPFIMKLCFSSSRSMTIKNGENNSGEGGEKPDQ
ncbi:unnamed protein product [Phaedon cochleariae]|uniref:RRM domain-containing protein n=1 Tax=Phaedon cochleariae TaxID=80249 RepID=A0A9N9SLL3_PHACE|nr:unnamed protein product [Phaedon cochleariae]